MKAIKILTMAALATAVFASCSSEDELAQSNYPMDNVVRIMTSVDGMNTKHSHPHFTGNDKGLYATMNRWFRATCFHGLKYLLY